MDNFLFDKNPRTSEPTFPLGRNLVQQRPSDLPGDNFEAGLLNALGAIHSKLSSNPDGLAADQAHARANAHGGTNAHDTSVFDPRARMFPNPYHDPHDQNVIMDPRGGGGNFARNPGNGRRYRQVVIPSPGEYYIRRGVPGVEETHAYPPQYRDRLDGENMPDQQEAVRRYGDFRPGQAANHHANHRRRDYDDDDFESLAFGGFL